MIKGRAEFVAVLAPVATAIRVHGDAGARITLDVDDSNLPEALKLIAWRDCILRVTIEPEDAK